MCYVARAPPPAAFDLDAYVGRTLLSVAFDVACDVLLGAGFRNYLVPRNILQILSPHDTRSSNPTSISSPSMQA